MIEQCKSNLSKKITELEIDQIFGSKFKDATEKNVKML